ncbi:septin-9-like [Arapaima gigas]
MGAIRKERQAYSLLPSESEVAPSYPNTMSEPTKPQPQPPARSDKPSVDFSYVGIDAILEQMRRKAMKQGFELNIMVVGEFWVEPVCVTVANDHSVQQMSICEGN